MAGACPLPQPGDPLVASLLGSTDCHVQFLVRSGYDALFSPSGMLSVGLTALLTVYVGLIGYRLLLGRAQLNISDLALSAVKLAAVVALATQWGSYQTLVYRTLFDGPQEIANALLSSFGAHGAGYGGDIFSGLQRAFDALTAFSPANPPGAPPLSALPPIPPGLATASPIATSLGPAGAAGAPPVSALLSKAGFDSLVLMASAIVLLLSTLGVLLISKVVLALLLALGPVFIALFLFDGTRGLFEGWLRASIAFAFAPLSTTLTLGLGLTLLNPSIAEIEAMKEANTYTPGVAFGVLVLVVVLAGVSLGLAVAAGFIAGGLKLPHLALAPRSRDIASGQISQPVMVIVSEPSRVDRLAAATASQERRDASIFARSAASFAISDNRGAATASGPRERSSRDAVAPDARLGQPPRRSAQPRIGRSARSEA